jgi:hypothetical protein
VFPLLLDDSSMSYVQLSHGLPNSSFPPRHC